MCGSLIFFACISNLMMRHHYYDILSMWSDPNNVIQNSVEIHGLFDQAPLFTSLVCYSKLWSYIHSYFGPEITSDWDPFKCY